MSTTNTNGRVLLVDDDPISLTQVQLLARAEGFDVRSVGDPLEALQILKNSPDSFDAVLTDFLMPEMNGVELVEKVVRLDPTLSSIVITSDTQRTTISASLKGGAVDFLEKPVNRMHIRESLRKAVARTAEHRQLRGSAARLETIKDLQHRLTPPFFSTTPEGLALSLATSFLPLHEAGGDFVTVYYDGRARVSLALGDISGHGVREGFIAAYFQGLVKGMQGMGAPSGQIARECNRLLACNWNSQELNEISTSLSATFVTVRLDTKELEAANYGCPAAVLCAEGSEPQTVASSGSPLGWFEEPSGSQESVPLPESGACYLWSDGLTDAAAKLGVSPYALAERVLSKSPLEGAGEIPDDILVACLRWHPAHQPPSVSTPILHEVLPGNTSGDVDALDERVKASLALAIEGIPADAIDEITLCTREAVLNALNHGCCGDAALRASLFMEYFAGEERLRVTVSDPGPGYTLPPPDFVPDFEVDEHISLGLKVIRALTTHLEFERRGATIRMDFSCAARGAAGSE